jgi:cytochrome c553
MMKKMVMLSMGILFVSNAWAADSMEEGKQLLLDNCMACHHAELDPPMGPPMFAVQMRYKRISADREDFIGKLTAFTLHPTSDAAVMQQAVKQLGVMPDIAANETDVRKIAAYIYDETFAPPCTHWQISIKAAKAKGDTQHAGMDQMMYNKWCADRPGR